MFFYLLIARKGCSKSTLERSNSALTSSTQTPLLSPMSLQASIFQLATANEIQSGLLGSPDEILALTLD